MHRRMLMQGMDMFTESHVHIPMPIHANGC